MQYSTRFHRLSLQLLLPIGLSTLLAACRSAAPVGDSPAILFDDFSYAALAGLPGNGWVVRNAQGWPGVKGAVWEGTLSLVDDEQAPGNRLIRMTASTDGTTTRQAQFCHQRKYLEGTYAARVRFSDAPISGPDGDQIVQTFYTVSPLKAPLDPDYSEQDFEYLPNGGWGGEDLTLHNTTWETFRPEPEWLQVNVSNARRNSLAGWHTLVLQISQHKVRYFLDGELFTEHGEPYYPEVHMSINFNLWFIHQGLIAATEQRVYQEDVDWVFHAAGEVLAPAAVEQQVAALRAARVPFKDTVPATSPALASNCDL